MRSMWSLPLALTAAVAGACAGDDPLIAPGIEGANEVTLAELPIPALPAVGISTGVQNACAVMAGGNVWCWGKRLLERDDTAPRTADCHNRCDTRPVRVQELSDIKQVAVGFAHACAVTRQGALLCWGSPDNGRLGDGNLARGLPQRSPALVAGIGDVQEVSTSWNHTCARSAAGEIWCWGEAQQGQFDGIAFGSRCGPEACVPLPTRIDLPPAVQVSAASMHACAVTMDGSVWCWGQRSALDPVDAVGCDPQPCGGRPSRLLGVPPAVQVAAGTTGTCALLRDGALFCWGLQVNALQSQSREDPRRPILPAAQAVSATVQTTPSFCALGRDQRVSCWGHLNIPVRGLYRSTFPAIEVPQAAGTQMLSVGSLNTCVIGIRGAVLCWGSNSDGQLGLGHTGADVFRPALVNFGD